MLVITSRDAVVPSILTLMVGGQIGLTEPTEVKYSVKCIKIWLVENSSRG